MATTGYVHGYSRTEAERLSDQAQTLASMLHEGVVFPAGALVLEAGCGVGAQTQYLAHSSPEAHFTSVDISAESLALAQKRISELGHENVEFFQGDIFDLPFAEASFDHAFICFVLEHLAQPQKALAAVRRMIKPGGTLTVIEGDHGSCYFHPETPEARAAWQCLIDSQASLGGDSLIGRRLYPLLAGAGFSEIAVRPVPIYADGSLPHMADGFTLKTICAMVEGVEDQSLADGLIDEDTWRRGTSDLRRTAEDDGVFCYTFFKGVARR